jgi:hypothetical protein
MFQRAIHPTPVWVAVATTLPRNEPLLVSRRPRSSKGDLPLTMYCTFVTSTLPTVHASRRAGDFASEAPFEGRQTVVRSRSLSTVTAMPVLVVDFPDGSVATLWRV